MWYKVIYISPDKAKIGYDKFTYWDSARSYMRWLKARGYHDVHIIKSDIGE